MADSTVETHGLLTVGTFTEVTVRFENCLPVLEPVTPYSRWYCSCGAVGGKRGTEDAARSDHARHVKESA